ncbi:hypothetical protein KP003_10945 [Geomonas nitrogeniifigens]|uniref:Phenylacetate-CoA ligase n=1 Tax=Geomonas diazotrophica TaxID=2843197 RepID=A0ABX8JBU4_9BACT|nr:hypothetical protein [Geomonas nitrogeniifigens]QWV95840.1 hypothetical protein KP005_10575 [Geomonas nitrogeniifigens]QXE84925.1 hypothetical protein KP003_10945 [Geomonas nitrogeniifigens]
MIDSVYKNFVYPLIFCFKGLNVKSKIAQISKLDKQHFKEVKNLQVVKLTGLLDIALSRSPFYRKVMAMKQGDIPGGLDAIGQFPVLTKEVIREVSADMLTNCSVAVARTTAGTTGVPVTVYVDKEALSWQLATRYYFFGIHGINIGDREARFWGRPQAGIKFKIRDFFLNRKRFNFCGDKDQLLIQVKSLVSYQPDYFYGYSSLILNAAIACAEHSVKPSGLKAIICTAELLTPQQRAYIKSVFACPVITEYGCTESDILAFECEFGRLHVMSHNVLIDESSGSGNFVYTDLNNTAMPIIRYDLGDDVQIDLDCRCECQRNLPVISQLKGRTIDQIITLPDGSTIHAVQFAYLIEDITNSGYDLLQFRIVYQRGKLKFIIHMNGDCVSFEKLLSDGIEKIINGRVPYSIKFEVVETEADQKFSYFEIKP